MIKENKNAINLTLLKHIGFYQIVDPNSPKIVGVNVYIVLHLLFIIFITIMAIIGLSGISYKSYEYLNNDLHQYMKTLFYLGCISVGNFKMITTIYNADIIWDLLDVVHASFLKSKHCNKNYD